MPQDKDEAPPAIPGWEPSELAKRIARGHAGSAHFEDVATDEVARVIQRVFEIGRRKRHGVRTLYWDADQGVAVLVNSRDRDGGTVFPSDPAYFDAWGDQEGNPE